MTDSGPLWLRILIASIPVLVALIGGAFLLANTVNRRTERLKNLVEIRKGFADGFNYDYTLERLMFRELQAIDQATTPWYRWYRRSLIVVVAAYLVISLLVSLPGIYGTGWSSLLALVGLTLAGAMGLTRWLLRNRRREFDFPHEVRFGILKALVEEEKGRSDAPQASGPIEDTSTDDMTEKTQSTDSTDETESDSTQPNE